MEMHHSRASMFSEQKFFWQLPTTDVNICSDILDLGGKLCVATVNPPTLYYIPDPRKASTIEIDLSPHFSKITRGEFRPRITLTKWGSDTSAVLAHEETVKTNDFKSRNQKPFLEQHIIVDRFGKVENY